MYFLQLYIVLIIKKMQNDFPRSVFRGDLLYFFRRKSLFFLPPVASAFRINYSSVSYLRRPVVPFFPNCTTGVPVRFPILLHALRAISVLRVICSRLAIPAFVSAALCPQFLHSVSSVQFLYPQHSPYSPCKPAKAVQRTGKEVFSSFDR